MRRAADVLDGAAGQLGSCVHVGGYLGPVARRHEATTDHETRMLHERIARLRQLAARLDGEANALEARQNTWRSRFAGKAAALPGNLGHQALNYLGWRLP
ncbi:MAG TPA: hypothetical protein VGO71_20000 [Baekduia sp.]|nr:hypothetical protein [Baekduia sp.]